MTLRRFLFALAALTLFLVAYRAVDREVAAASERIRHLHPTDLEALP